MFKMLIFIVSKRVSLNDNELPNYIQQIISYLEYLKFEFARHFYILNSFSMQREYFKFGLFYLYSIYIHFKSTTCDQNTGIRIKINKYK